MLLVDDVDFAVEVAGVDVDFVMRVIGVGVTTPLLMDLTGVVLDEVEVDEVVIDVVVNNVGGTLEALASSALLGDTDVHDTG